MTERFFTFETWYQETIAKKPAKERIVWLESEIENTGDFWIKKCILMHLYGDYMYLLQFDDALDTVNREICIDPDNPLPFITKAGLLLSFLERPQEALEVIENGITLSAKSGNYRRHALAEKARIALHMDNYEMLNQILNSIAELKLAKGAEDVGKESDFFDGADKARLFPDTILKYQKYLTDNVTSLKESY